LIRRLGIDFSPRSDHLSGQEGQDVIDSLSVLQVILPFISDGVNNRIAALMPLILGVSCSTYGVLRNCAAKTLAVACKALPNVGMLFVIENVLPLLGDASNEINRSGGIEAIYCM
jgi:TATA-binding protein-associated factor